MASLERGVKFGDVDPSHTSLSPLSHLPGTETVVVLDKIAQNYAECVMIETAKERQIFNESVEDILAKLEEFLSLSDLIRSDVNLSLNTTLNGIHAKSKEIEKYFDRIDKLEAFVMMVKKNVNEIESAVEGAESELSGLGSIRKALNSISIPFLSSSKSTSNKSSAATAKIFEPVSIYRTEDYFATSPADSNNGNSNDDAKSHVSDVDNVNRDEYEDLDTVVNKTLPTIRDDQQEGKERSRVTVDSDKSTLEGECDKSSSLAELAVAANGHCGITVLSIDTINDVPSLSSLVSNVDAISNANTLAPTDDQIVCEKEREMDEHINTNDGQSNINDDNNILSTD